LLGRDRGDCATNISFAAPCCFKHSSLSAQCSGRQPSRSEDQRRSYRQTDTYVLPATASHLLFWATHPAPHHSHTITVFDTAVMQAASDSFACCDRGPLFSCDCVVAHSKQVFPDSPSPLTQNGELHTSSYMHAHIFTQSAFWQTAPDLRSNVCSSVAPHRSPLCTRRAIVSDNICTVAPGIP
jgi:hypothetical protein